MANNSGISAGKTGVAGEHVALAMAKIEKSTLASA